MIKEVIVVEGKSDIARVRMAVEADMIATEGFTLRSAVLKDIRCAYEKRGMIILTDPDGAGERIRRRLSQDFPRALHAFVPKKLALAKDDVGIENASPESIREALEKVHPCSREDSCLFSEADMTQNGLAGCGGASEKRADIGALLGIGYGNGKQFLKRLNHFGITRDEWESALTAWERQHDHRIGTD